jgi:predicted translin family RNA/ssDNA-binding protein
LLLHTQAPAARAQTPAEAKAVAEAERLRAELEPKALRLVEEALAEAQSLKLLENRVRAQTTAARLLWPRDAKAARAAFASAADGVAELNAAVDPEDPQLYNAAQTVGQLRVELVNAASPYDANLALEFLRATRPTYSEAMAAAGYGQPLQEQSLEMSIVASIAAQEPRRALELAQESLGKGVTLSLLGVVQQLMTKEPASASKLVADIVRRLRPEDLRGQNEAGAVAQQLLALARPTENVPVNGVVNSTGPSLLSVGRGVPDSRSVSVLDEQTRRELVEKVLAAVAGGVQNQGGGYSLYHAFQALLPELEKSAPTRVAAMRRKADEMERNFNPYIQQMRPYQEVMQTGTAEAVLEAARKAPAEVRDQLYMHAAWKTHNEGADPERARQILENISNPQLRAQARREMEQRAHWRSVQQGDYKEARQAVSRLKMPEERVQALLQIAGRAAAAGDAETARQVLEEARGLVESQTRGQQQFAYRLQVANAYVQFDADASFELAESAVARLDGLLESAEAVDGFGQESFREGELRPQGGYIWNEMVNQCAQTLALLARADFERAAAAAKKFRRPEARTSAQLTLAQSVLVGFAPPNRNTGFAAAPIVIYRRSK